jgi:hypothetical protein
MQAPGNAQTKLDSGRKQVNAKQTRKNFSGFFYCIMVLQTFIFRFSLHVTLRLEYNNKQNTHDDIQEQLWRNKN